MQNNLSASVIDTSGQAIIQKKENSVILSVTPVLLPAAAWLMGAGIAGLIGFSRRKVAL